MATATKDLRETSYKEKFGELYDEASKAVEHEHPRVGNYLKAAQFAKDSGKEKDMERAASSAMNLYLKLSNTDEEDWRNWHGASRL
jgi:hypothetical protein